MKKILLLVMICCAVAAAQAQRVYFMYVQTDNRTPFYLKTGDKVYSSSAQGYLIVPKLVDSTYNIVIGKSGISEARFTVPVNGKDRGFMLRESGQQLSLFDLQSMELIEAAASTSVPVSYTKKTDRFTTLLAQAADDTTLLHMVVFAKNDKPQLKAQEAIANTTTPPAEAPKPVTEETSMPAKDTQTVVVQMQNVTSTDTAATVATADAPPQKQQQEEVVVAKTEQVKEENKAVAQPTITNEPAAEENVYKRSVVVRHAESSTSEGFGLVFIDNVDGVIDTIRLVIPNPKVAFNAIAENTEIESKEEPRFLELNKTVTEPVATTEAEAETGRKRRGLFGNRKDAEQEQKTAAAGKNEAPAEKAKPVQAEEACRSQASGNDFARLRRNMVSKNSEDDMVAEAQKAFQNKCYTTQQLKTLSSLLLTSNGRYRLFEAAYNHVSDKENFRSLQNELWDRPDLERFKALIAR